MQCNHHTHESVISLQNYLIYIFSRSEGLKLSKLNIRPGRWLIIPPARLLLPERSCFCVVEGGAGQFIRQLTVEGVFTEHVANFQITLLLQFQHQAGLKRDALAHAGQLGQVNHKQWVFPGDQNRRQRLCAILDIDEMVRTWSFV